MELKAESLDWSDQPAEHDLKCELVETHHLNTTMVNEISIFQNHERVGAWQRSSSTERASRVGVNRVYNRCTGCVFRLRQMLVVEQPLHLSVGGQRSQKDQQTQVTANTNKERKLRCSQSDENFTFLTRQQPPAVSLLNC